jgi:S1-C subfamily serine protease
MSSVRAKLWLFAVFLFCYWQTSFADEAKRFSYKELLKSVAWIVSSEGTATGWVIAANEEDGKVTVLVVTNYHVVDIGKRYLMRWDVDYDVYFPVYENGELMKEKDYYRSQRKLAYEAKVVDYDAAHDLALLNVKWTRDVKSIRGDTRLRRLRPLEIAKSVDVGDQLHTVGNPGSSDALWIYGSGAVRQIYNFGFQYNTGQSGRVKAVQMQVPINPGDSGGPIVDSTGALVAVNACSVKDASLINFGVHLSEVTSFMNKGVKYLDYPSAYYSRGKFIKEDADLSPGKKMAAVELYISRGEWPTARVLGSIFSDHEKEKKHLENAYKLKHYSNVALLNELYEVMLSTCDAYRTDGFDSLGGSQRQARIDSIYNAYRFGREKTASTSDFRDLLKDYIRICNRNGLQFRKKTFEDRRRALGELMDKYKKLVEMAPDEEARSEASDEVDALKEVIEIFANEVPHG